MRRACLAVGSSFAAALLTGCASIPEPASNTASSFSDCDQFCPQMTIVPAGSFAMGGEGGEEGRPEWPVHTVTIGYDFALGTYEVTNREYALFAEETGHQPSGNCRSFDPQTLAVDHVADATFRNPGPGAGQGEADLPAACISWTDAQAYLDWLSQKSGKTYRLPTEAEWEYAASAGSSADYPWGAASSDMCDYANGLDLQGVRQWFPAVANGEDGAPKVSFADCDDGFAGASAVGSLRANAFGLHDMIGNVWEWTQDCYVAPYASDVPVDGSAYFNPENCERRSVRGGSWITDMFRMRPAWRGRDPVEQVSWIFGMRVARDLEAGEVR